MNHKIEKQANYDYEDFYGTVFIESIVDEKSISYRVSVLLPIGSVCGCPSKHFNEYESAVEFFMKVCSIVYASKHSAYYINENNIWEK